MSSTGSGLGIIPKKTSFFTAFLSEADEAKVAALLETPELAKQLDRKAFEEKLDEVNMIIEVFADKSILLFCKFFKK